ncbi:hypothetical protein [Thalassotalea sp. Y01]|nr:hypothetical protein [Thalassotalea sp. Y01]NMP16756.1 hypothetical protein [Thalassotalea sp. Y01]
MKDLNLRIDLMLTVKSLGFDVLSKRDIEKMVGREGFEPSNRFDVNG